MKNEFIRLIKKGIKDHKISLRELARNSDLDVSFLSKILSGKRNPPSNESDIKKIAKILLIDQDRLLFSAGRIPARLQDLFTDMNFIKNLPGSIKKKSVPEKKTEKKQPQKSKKVVTPKIEDELL